MLLIRFQFEDSFNRRILKNRHTNEIEILNLKNKNKNFDQLWDRQTKQQ